MAAQALGRPFAIAGVWGRLGSVRAAVFVREGDVRLAVDRDEWSLDDRLQASLERHGRETTLRIAHDEAIVACLTYRTPRTPSRHWSDWPLDVEDYDFGAFIVRMMVRRVEEPELTTVWPFSRSLGSERAATQSS